MDNAYYETVDKLEKAGVDPEYINGWACGWLRNPKREEQRITDAYTAGYEDGYEKNTDHMNDWVKK
jgi:hypothetical protein